jgi:hypothetical protein
MGSFVLNIILTIFLWVPGIIHAILVVNDYYEDRRFNRYMREVRRRY